MLIQLADDLVDDILRLSDSEIQAEATEDFDDPKQVAREVQELVNSTAFYRL